MEELNKQKARHATVGCSAIYQLHRWKMYLDVDYCVSPHYLQWRKLFMSSTKSVSSTHKSVSSLVKLDGININIMGRTLYKVATGGGFFS